MNADEERHLEKWKSVIDFSKVVIGLSTSVLTVVLGLVVVRQLSQSVFLYIIIGGLAISILSGLASFGWGIKSLGSGVSHKRSIVFANAAAVALMLSVASILFTPKSDVSINAILISIENETTSMQLPTQPKDCVSIQKSNDDYIILYADSNRQIQVTYSTKSEQIIHIKRTP